jgi:hypothetical protein
MSDAQKTPNLVTAEIAAVSRDYLYRWVELGMLEGSLGNMRFSPEIAEIMEAVHHVLAGGRVEVEIQEPGAAPIVEELESMLQQSLREGIVGDSSKLASS